MSVCCSVALFTQTDMERLAKEVSTMLSFEHKHVMALIGVIMPFMSNGSVLEFVRHHKDELLCIDSSVEMVLLLTSELHLNIAY